MFFLFGTNILREVPEAETVSWLENVENGCNIIHIYLIYRAHTCKLLTFRESFAVTAVSFFSRKRVCCWACVISFEIGTPKSKGNDIISPIKRPYIKWVIPHLATNQHPHYPLVNYPLMILTCYLCWTAFMVKPSFSHYLLVLEPHHFCAKPSINMLPTIRQYWTILNKTTFLDHPGSME
jgi:hypothetical protein